MSLPNLPLSQDLFLDGAHSLGPPAGCSEQEMATRVVMIRQRLSENWGVGVCYIDDMHSKYIADWGLMSLLLLCEEQGIPLTGTDARELRGIEVAATQDVEALSFGREDSTQMTHNRVAGLWNPSLSLPTKLSSVNNNNVFSLRKDRIKDLAVVILLTIIM